MTRRPWFHSIRPVRVLGLALVSLASLPSSQALAGELSRTDLEKKFAPPLILGEPDPALPLTPIFRDEGGEAKLAGYVFESADLAPVPGFSGTPPNLLVTIDAEGRFLEVSVLSQQEPVFQHGLGPGPLDQFVTQYAGKSLARGVRVAAPGESAHTDGTGLATINGVAKATASVRIMNQSILGAALAVARAKLGAVGGGHGATPVKPEWRPLDFAAMATQGLIAEAVFTEADLAAAFAGTPVDGPDPEAPADPEAVYAHIRLAYLNIPSVGENLLGPDNWRRVTDLLDGGQALWVSVAGRARPFDPPYALGGTPENLTLTQDGLTLEVKDFVLNAPLALADAPQAPFTILKVFPMAGFDPARPFTLSLEVTREKGQIFPERFTEALPLPVSLPARWFEPVTESTPVDTGWRSVWRDRTGDLAVLGVGLTLLMALLAGQPATMRASRLFPTLRLVVLAYTLVVIGWLFQAQLSIVTLAGLVRAALVTGDVTFLLWDPPSLILWAVVLVTAILWGRGTFCGWLCPYGALQDLVEAIGRPLKLRQLRVPDALDRRLRWVKYAVLGGFLAITALWPAQAETAAEIEPFKTAITMVFDRSWPAVLWALVPLVATLFVHKAFCRYLCPLGAFMAILGRLRRFDWIARRVDCGSPCRLCERRCRYGAIDRAGRVDYGECFQCMDCVVIHEDPKTCVPLVLAAKGRSKGEVSP